VDEKERTVGGKRVGLDTGGKTVPNKRKGRGGATPWEGKRAGVWLSKTKAFEKKELHRNIHAWRSREILSGGGGIRPKEKRGQSVMRKKARNPKNRVGVTKEV